MICCIRVCLVVALCLIGLSSATAQDDPPIPLSPDTLDELALTATIGRGAIHVMAASPEGRLLALGGDRGIWLYDTQLGGGTAVVAQPGLKQRVNV